MPARVKGQSMDARNRFDDSGSGLFMGDWRGPGDTGRKVVPAAAPAPARPQLHLQARRASLAQERKRARDIVSAAKTQIVSAFDDVRFGHNLNVEALWPLVTAITASVERHPAAILGVTRIKDRHEYTYLHTVAVCGLMIELARRLKLPTDQHHDIGLAGLLHDVGKARLPTTLLDKPGALTAQEQSVMHQHCQLGHDILTSSEQALPAVVLDVCLHHHERLDGSGYPDRRSGNNVSLAARMAAICDVYDAVTSPRPYKACWSPAEAIEYMAERPHHFDPEVLRAFTGMIGIFPVGSMVRLQSERLAVVLDEPEENPLAPAVCPFFCVMTKQLLPLRRISPEQDPIIGIEVPSRWRIGDWNAIRADILAHFAGGMDPAD